MHARSTQTNIPLVGMCVSEMCYSAVPGFWLMEFSKSRLGASQ